MTGIEVKLEPSPRETWRTRLAAYIDLTRVRRPIGILLLALAGALGALDRGGRPGRPGGSP